MKQCIECFEWVEKVRYSNKCIRCHDRQKFKEWKERNKEKYDEHQQSYKKQYYIDNKEHINNKNNTYYANNKEHINNKNKLYYQNNKEHINKINKQWVINNPERKKQIDDEWYQNNKERSKENTKNWCKNNPIKVKQIIKNNKAKRKIREKNQIGYLPENWLQILEERDTHCKYCNLHIKTYGYELDHIHPISKGGLHDFDNLQLICSTCNRKKGNKLEEEFIKTLI